ncbi:hypothetical protein PENSPDRAFT_686425 [Peniophora sp. CONT]|nr:hypothetical protein PENSPDRAFT_686425 [Peniophora sp. CONT]
MSQSVAGRLPPEIVDEIVLFAVYEDTVDRTWSALPIAKNVAWKSWDNFPLHSRNACVMLKRDCVTTGFVERALSCSLSTEPEFAAESTAIDAPPGLFHRSLVCMQVCRGWRHALREYRSLWSMAGLLNPTFITRSKSLAGRFRSELVNLRPLCACFLKHCIPHFSSAEKIVFTTYAFADDTFTVSESVLRELEAAAAHADGCVLRYLDLQLTCPEDSVFFVTRDTMRIDTLHTARLTNTHFTCFGASLSRLELVAENSSWRNRPEQIFKLLLQCPVLQHLSLVTFCKSDNDIALDEAWDPDTSVVVALPHLSCFILEDEGRPSLELLSSIKVPSTADFHWVVIEPFGTLNYRVPDLEVHLDFFKSIYRGMTFDSRSVSVAVLEIIPDFDGYHLDRVRQVREWPEELRVTFTSSISSALSQFVLRPGHRRDVLYRDLTADRDAPRRSFAVRSEMLSTCVSRAPERYRPFQYLSYSANAKRHWVDVPDFQVVIRSFMSSLKSFDDFQGIDTIVIPRHAYHPQGATSWGNMLNGLDVTSIVLPGVTQTDQLDAFAAHIATGRSQPNLNLVYLPNIYSGGELLTQKEIDDYMDFRLVRRTGCSEIRWDADKLA